MAESISREVTQAKKINDIYGLNSDNNNHIREKEKIATQEGKI